LERPLRSATEGGEWVPNQQLAAGWASPEGGIPEEHENLIAGFLVFLRVDVGVAIIDWVRAASVVKEIVLR
jgi:hypothetical protein